MEKEQEKLTLNGFKCSKCIHAYKEYPYNDQAGKYLYCGLHSFGTVEADFFCKSFEKDENKGVFEA